MLQMHFAFNVAVFLFCTLFVIARGLTFQSSSAFKCRLTPGVCRMNLGADGMYCVLGKQIKWTQL